jgi:hypothetical protein
MGERRSCAVRAHVTLGFEPVVSTPDAFSGQIKEEIETWGNMIRTAHIKGQ